MKDKLFLASIFISLVAMAIAFLVTPKEANPGAISVFTFIIVFLGTAAILNLLKRKKQKTKEQ
jgi:hypothetical protein